MNLSKLNVLFVIALGIALAYEPSRLLLVQNYALVTSSPRNMAVYGLPILGVLLLYVIVQLKDSTGRVGAVSNLFADQAPFEKSGGVKGVYDSYESLYGKDSRKGGQEHEQLLAKRLALYTQMVNQFYDLVTDFYEYGWGESFHFGPRAYFENHWESLRRHEYYIASRLGLSDGMVCADLGCGVGGPMRAIARFTGAKIVGINNNDYQIKVGTKHNQRDQLSDLCSMTKADFMHIPVADGHFDRAYAIEATCHAPNKAECFTETFRTLKEGGLFAIYDWVVTEKYDEKNHVHRAIKEGIEVGNGLPTIATKSDVLDAMQKAGFEVVDSMDVGNGVRGTETQVGWYDSLAGSMTLRGFRRTSIGRFITHLFVTILEFLCIAPRGSVKVSKMLNDTANDLVAGGELGIFTPCFFVLGRKPLGSGGGSSKGKKKMNGHSS